MIPTLNHEPGLRSDELDALQAELNKEIGSLNRRRAAVEGTLQTLLTTPKQLLKSDQIAKAHDEKVAAINLLREEFSIRHKIGESYLPALKAARSAAAEKAFEDHAAVVAKTTTKLVSAGFADGNIPGTEIPSLTDGLLSRHPDVYASLQRRGEAHARSQESAEEIANADAMKKLGEQIDQSIKLLSSTHH